MKTGDSYTGGAEDPPIFLICLRSDHYGCFTSGKNSGKKKEHKPKLFGPDIFGRVGGLSREWGGAKKFSMYLKPKETKLFGRISRDFCRDIPAVPERFEKKSLCSILVLKNSEQKSGTDFLTSETVRIRFRGARFQTPSSVSFLGSPSSGERAQWVPFSLWFACQGELTEFFFAELPEFAPRLSEAQWVLSSETVLSKQYSAPFPITADVDRRPRWPDDQVTGRNQVSTTFCFSALFWSFPPKTPPHLGKENSHKRVRWRQAHSQPEREQPHHNGQS